MCPLPSSCRWKAHLRGSPNHAGDYISAGSSWERSRELLPRPSAAMYGRQQRCTAATCAPLVYASARPPHRLRTHQAAQPPAPPSARRPNPPGLRPAVHPHCCRAAADGELCFAQLKPQPLPGRLDVRLQKASPRKDSALSRRWKEAGRSVWPWAQRPTAMHCCRGGCVSCGMTSAVPQCTQRDFSPPLPL